MKILWLSSSRFSDQSITTTGTWLRPLALSLVNSGQIKLFNIVHTAMPNLMEEEYRGITQYCLPKYTSFERRFVSTEPKRYCKQIKEIIDRVNPDVIHIWGTESNYLSLIEKIIFNRPVFVDMQGVMSTISVNLSKNLSFSEFFKCNIGLKNFFDFQTSLLYQKWYYNKKSRKELEWLASVKNVSVQSAWVEAQLKGRIPNLNILHTGIILREEFYEASRWTFHDRKSPILFSCASSTSIPYKGFYSLLKALTIIKKQYPNVLLRLAGNKPSKRLFATGFERILHKYIKENSLEDNIIYTGPLNALQLCEELKNTDICVIPSYVETYCLALAEAQMIGTPCVVSYAGAMPEIATPDNEACFFDPSDYYQMAFKICNLFNDKEKCIKMSDLGIKKRLKENDPNTITNNQIANYKKLISDYEHNK